MTIISTILTPKNVIQISDRRLTANGKIVDAESCKMVFLVTKDGEYAVSYTGLARYEKFETSIWLHANLLYAAPPDYAIVGIASRLRDALTRLFSDKYLSKVAPAHRGLTVVISGITNREMPGSGAIFRGLSSCIITNLLNEDGSFRKEAGSRFFIANQIALPHRATIFTHPRRFDQTREFKELVKLATRLPPSKAIRNKAAKAIQTLADKPIAAGLIGKDLTSITFPVDPNLPPQFDFHSGRLADDVEEWVDYLEVRGPQQRYMGRFEVPKDGKVYRVPYTRMNAPCPCKSGKTYRDCHGGADGGPAFTLGFWLYDIRPLIKDEFDEINVRSSFDLDANKLNVQITNGQSENVGEDGPAPPVSRNAPCPCDSGKKYKNCHGELNPTGPMP